MSTNKKREMSESPLYISLNGAIYCDKSKTLVGVLSDARLVALDAFLDSLSNSKEFVETKGNFTMADALRQMVEKCHPKLLANSDVVMEVTSKLDLDKKEMTHVFRISAQPKK